MSKQPKLIIDGIADRKKYIHGLRECPSLVPIRNEAGSGNASISCMCRAFDRLLIIVDGALQ